MINALSGLGLVIVNRASFSFDHPGPFLPRGHHVAQDLQVPKLLLDSAAGTSTFHHHPRYFNVGPIRPAEANQMGFGAGFYRFLSASFFSLSARHIFSGVAGIFFIMTPVAS